MTRTGQANLGNGTAGDVRTILDRLRDRGAKVIALQEAGDRGAIIALWCRDNGWDGYFGVGEGAASTPIIWDKRVRVTHLGTHAGTDATYTGKLGAGPSTVKAKVLNHGRFEEPGEKPFVLINFHNPASLYLRRRRALAKTLMTKAGEMVARHDRIEVRVVGDANCRPTASVMKPLRKAGLKQCTKGRTHDVRTIDQAWAVDGHGEPIVVPSDHRAVLLPRLHDRIRHTSDPRAVGAAGGPTTT